ncbi:MAG: class I SAM-dependent methyltransferase [Flavobacteriales bacterium]
MLYKITYYIFKLFPRLKRWFWKKWYTIFANKVSNPDLRFMNYGYYSDDLNIELSAEEEKDRYSIHLYHHVASQINLTGLKVLEVGSGRGGGCSYVSRYLKPSEMYGIDISPSAVDICNNIYNIDNLTFKVGDSENLPFEDNTFDAVINVESSHCYASMDKFIQEVSRVLKPNAYFLFCDLRRDIYIQEMMDSINSNGLKLISKTNISTNIIEATIRMSKDRKGSINKLKSGWFRNVLESFAAVEGSKVHQSFEDGYLHYISAYFKNEK